MKTPEANAFRGFLFLPAEGKTSLAGQLFYYIF